MQNEFPTLFPDEELQDDWLLANKCVSLIFLLSHIHVCTQVCAYKCRCMKESWLSQPGWILDAHTEYISFSHCSPSDWMYLPLSSDCHASKSLPLRTGFGWPETEAPWPEWPRNWNVMASSILPCTLLQTFRLFAPRNSFTEVCALWRSRFTDTRRETACSISFELCSLWRMCYSMPGNILILKCSYAM